MAATSDQAKGELKTQLVGRAQIASSEQVSLQLDLILDQAYSEYAPSNVGDYLLLTKREYELVLILAWIRVCDSRASAYAAQASISGAGAGFGSDRDTPFAKNSKLAKELRFRYSELLASLTTEEDGDSGGITVGELVRHDDLIDASVPLSQAQPLRAPRLSSRSPTTVSAGGTLQGTVILSWTEVKSEYFSEAIIVINDTAGIAQDWNGAGNNDKVPNVATASSAVYRTTDSKTTATKLSYLAAGTYYFVLALRDANGRFTFSNEITVVIAA